MSNSGQAELGQPSQPGLSPANRRSMSSRLGFIVRVAFLRLRFLLVFIGILGVLASWERLGRARDWIANRVSGTAAAEATVSPDREYFCPMCPGVLSNWPEKCPVCKMPLVQRRKGEAVLLPEGVLARMQLTPYRLRLAGIQTSLVQYHAVHRKWSSIGTVDSEGGQVECIVAQSDVPFIRLGQIVAIQQSAAPERKPLAAEVILLRPNGAATSESVIAVIAPKSSGVALTPGATVEVQWRTPMADVEPFRSLPRNPPPLGPNERREVYVCDEHPQYVHLEQGKCTFHDLSLTHQVLLDNQRLEWVCPAHPELHATAHGACPDCSDLPLIPQIVTYSPPGKVLAVPESALIDTGERQWVFVESAPGMFDAVLVQVGELCEDVYPVVSGLEANQRVVSAGAFLLDAETRLSPNLAASYFGANAGGDSQDQSLSEVFSQQESTEAIEKLELAPGDRARIELQRSCPVTKFPLGSMGAPTRVRVGDQIVYLCCDGCMGSVRGGIRLGSSVTPWDRKPALEQRPENGLIGSEVRGTEPPSPEPSSSGQGTAP